MDFLSSDPAFVPYAADAAFIHELACRQRNALFAIVPVGLEPPRSHGIESGFFSDRFSVFRRARSTTDSALHCYKISPFQRMVYVSARLPTGGSANSEQGFAILTWMRYYSSPASHATEFVLQLLSSALSLVMRLNLLLCGNT
jgi:hypothetical protein